jgi:hypothetical protein
MEGQMPPRKRKPKDDKPGEEDLRNAHTEEAEAVRVHEAWMEDRLGGGPPPDPKVRRRASEQFQDLPGALRATPPRVAPAEPSEEVEPADDQRPEEES